MDNPSANASEGTLFADPMTLGVADGADAGAEPPPPDPPFDMTDGMFTFGDRVVHSDRPEWGVGRVLGAEPATIEGAPAQRLRVRFERGGLKTLTMPPANLALADASAGLNNDQAAGGWLDQIAEKSPEERFSQLPESATDPFASLEARIRATLDLYRFDADGASLIDWAAAQSGLSDPLTRYSRHHLEQLFRRFDRAREKHLAELLNLARRTAPQAIRAALADAPPKARAILQRLTARR